MGKKVRLAAVIKTIFRKKRRYVTEGRHVTEEDREGTRQNG